MMRTWIEKSKNDWNERATDWHKKSDRMWTSGSRKDVIPVITEHLAQGSSLLDVGCGDGVGAYLAAEKGYHVTGIDVSSNMIKLANSRKKKNLSFETGALSEMEFKNASFDAAMCINSLEWTEDPYKELIEIDRVIRAGGYIFCAILGPAAAPRKNSFNRLTGEQTICNTMMPWELSELTKKLKWEQFDERYVYKEQVDLELTKNLPAILKQSLTFFTLFVFSKKS